MVSDEMVWSIGASGIAWDADIAIRLRRRQTQKRLAVSWISSFPFVIRRYAADLNSQTIQRSGSNGPPYQ
jgi:hypothetical protein